VMKRLVQYPAYNTFEAIEEAYVYAVRAGAEVKAWADIQKLYKTFLAKHEQSLRRPHMDLFEAVSLMESGKRVEALPKLSSLARSDTYQDVKADAFYFLGVYQMTKLHEDYKAAMKNFETSIRLYPRERSCLTAAKCAIELNNWDRAHVLLERTLRDFPAGKPDVLKEATRLLPTAKKKIAEG